MKLRGPALVAFGVSALMMLWAYPHQNGGGFLWAADPADRSVGGSWVPSPMPPAFPVAFSVPAIANIAFAGQPNGVTLPYGSDTTPQNSPVLCPEAVTPGQILQFSASGFVDINGSPTPQTPPDGNTTSMCEAGGNFGIARIYGPCGALIGVFLNPFDPDPTTPPDELDFRGAARRVPTLRPSLQQPFYIGSGRLPSSTDYRNIVVPAGATRLFLGVLDHCCSYGYNSDNTGSFAVTITEVPPPPPDAWPNVFATTNISLAGQPDGTNLPYGLDTTPLNSPLLVPATLIPDEVLQFSASGFVDINGNTNPQTPPDGNTSSMCEAGGYFGIARIYGPCGALIGVFLNPFDPDPSTPPDELDFRGAARRVPTLRPSLQQPFYIGSGRLPSSSDYRNVVVPAGATRLFLGVLDHCCSYGYNSENTGSFAVTITEVPPPPPDPWPNVFAITNISLAGQPDGTNFPYGLDTAPLNSPLLVPGTLMPGRLHFSASGFVDINGNTNPQTTPDGNTSSACEAGGYFGIARISGPCGALIGLFLGPNPPNPANTPPDVDFSGEARNLPTLEPLQQQPFYVGRGLLPSSSNYRNIVVPFGATRLFLGVLDHCCSYGYNSENTGWFEVDITGFEVPGLNFDGDHKADISVFRPSTGEWFIRPSHTPESFWQIRWGVPTDVVVPADYDGDGRIDVAVWRPSQGTSEGIWYIVPSSAQPGSYQVRQWGVQTDRPYPADYDGDGKEDIAVWRPDSGIWYVLPTGSPGTYTSTQWGLATDIPVAADYDGDGRTDIAVWRPGMGVWYIMPSSKPGTYDSTQWGVSTDIPVPADYDGDGKTDIAVWRPSEGNWYILTTNSPGYTRTQWGVPTDIPVPFDYDGDGKTDIAVWRPGTGVWYILPSSSPGTYVGIRWGVPSDVPLSVITKILRCLP